ncbi:MAG: DUF1232 domain-containing protein [Gammaproteobacteria bacterium]|nr:DUF1232 domain-containing protein [Gammaproteobacteria bacterium]
MKIAFELTDRDLRYFQNALKQSRNAVRYAEESEILDAIRDVLDDIRSNAPLPDFVAHRIPQIESMIQMLSDEDWALPVKDRESVLAVFIYFGDPEDILPDDVPVIGYLDDVIVVELVMQELRHVREAYADFCEFRSKFDKQHGPNVDGAFRRDRIDRRRQALHQRMQRRTSKKTLSS